MSPAMSPEISPTPAVVLVHGAWHDSSSWAPLRAELGSRGVPVVAPDLPSDRPGLGAEDYARVVVDAVEAAGADPVVLVGHSLGGLTAPVVAQLLGPERVTALVLVAALLPDPGRSWNDQARADRTMMAPGFGAGAVRRADGTTEWPPDAAAEGLYRGVAQESSDDLVRVAVAGLRPQAWAIGKEITPLTGWPAIRTISVVCAQDRVVEPAWSRRAAAVLGAEVVELAGGHFPMLTRPAELAEILTRAAAAAGG
ncbi:MAG: alpha/beta hydrolase [Pseudonocardia sp.]|nr:alpha/beta hydrolase [Pseudonocardia sp.]